MTELTAVARPLSIRIRDEAKALGFSVAFTAFFVVIYCALAPVVLLAGLLGGPLWAACFGLWLWYSR